MTCLTENAFVEHVARAICKARGIDPDEPTFGSGSTSHPTVIYERRLDRQKVSARAAIRATLEWLGDDRSDSSMFEDIIYAMREAFRKTRRGSVSGMTIDAQFAAEYAAEIAMFHAMLSAAINELEAGK